MMFACRPCQRVKGFPRAGHSEVMADLFAIVGLVTVTLLGLTLWWEEH
jgi:hypothetical protein